MSTRPPGVKPTPSASSMRRCSSGPPNAKPGASEPSAKTTRWHGTPPATPGLPCMA